MFHTNGATITLIQQPDKDSTKEKMTGQYHRSRQHWIPNPLSEARD